MHGSIRVYQFYYRLIETAIRWAGILEYERDILSALSPPRHLPETLDCPRWHKLRLCMDRVYDAFINGELPYSRVGITLNDPARWHSPDLTIRHLDLRHGMRDHYPEHRPGFLFSRRERIAHPILTLEAGQAMVVECPMLKVQFQHYRRELQNPQDQRQGLTSQNDIIEEFGKSYLTERAKTTYLPIMGGMLELMLGQSPPRPIPASKLRQLSSVYLSPITALSWESPRRP